MATYSVTPAQTAPYFSKIQCFCFEEQRLNAGETVDMPVFFYLDPDLLTDLNMRGVETVTLSYTFFSKHCSCLSVFLFFFVLYICVSVCVLLLTMVVQRRNMTIMGLYRDSRQHHDMIDKIRAGQFHIEQLAWATIR